MNASEMIKAGQDFSNHLYRNIGGIITDKETEMPQRTHSDEEIAENVRNAVARLNAEIDLAKSVGLKVVVKVECSDGSGWTNAYGLEPPVISVTQVLRTTSL